MLYNNCICYFKIKFCFIIIKFNFFNVFYDKVFLGYIMWLGDCFGNDIWGIYGFVFLLECVNWCNSDSRCVLFMYYDNKECFFKIKICVKFSMVNFKNVFYDKIKYIIFRGYEMRFGDCFGNDIWFFYGFVFLEECVRCCNGNFGCVLFMFYDGCECYLKIKICLIIDKMNVKNFFYDKIKIIWICDVYIFK